MTLPNVLLLELNDSILRNLPLEGSRYNHEWNSVYVNSPEAALEVISNRNISVVVTNLGAKTDEYNYIFQEIIYKTEAAVQFVCLLDNVEDELNDTIDCAHQCISSKSDYKDILIEIKRGLIIEEKTRKNKTLSKLLLKLNKLPTPPTLYFDLRDELESKNCSMESLANIISRDQAITVKILKVANSGFYGVPRSIVELKRAISLLGTELVLGVVLTSHFFDNLPLPGLNLDRLWKHNFIVSAIAKYIAQEQGGDRDAINASGLAGLLHDIGILVMLTNFPSQYNNIIRQVAGNEIELLQREYEQFGATHPEIGGLALRMCNLSDEIITATEMHHQQMKQTDLLIVRAVSLAESLVNKYTNQAGGLYDDIDVDGLDCFSPLQLENAWKKCTDIIESVQL